MHSIRNLEPVRVGRAPFDITSLVSIYKEQDSEKYSGDSFYGQDLEEAQPLDKVKCLAGP